MSEAHLIEGMARAIWETVTRQNNDGSHAAWEASGDDWDDDRELSREQAKMVLAYFWSEKLAIVSKTELWEVAGKAIALVANALPQEDDSDADDGFGAEEDE